MITRIYFGVCTVLWTSRKVVYVGFLMVSLTLLCHICMLKLQAKRGTASLVLGCETCCRGIAYYRPGRNGSSEWNGAFVSCKEWREEVRTKRWDRKLRGASVGEGIGVEPEDAAWIIWVSKRYFGLLNLTLIAWIVGESCLKWSALNMYFLHFLKEYTDGVQWPDCRTTQQSPCLFSLICANFLYWIF